ncbi:hypothetical protein WJX74_004479 [Apatococcus lobatus]|uniref:PHD-type domain-containing protein n=1 Tax=Apatococcus lobatus TaxID=904363 RepID=A0AAW1S6H5_9CHLO
MTKGGYAARKKQKREPAQEGGYLHERAVFGPTNLPSGDDCLPLRLLDGFEFFMEQQQPAAATGDPGQEAAVQIVERLAGLEILEQHAGAVVWGRGLLLDHKTAAASADEAVQACRIRVSLGPVRDWVMDYSNPLIIWAVTDTAWYRLMRPTEDYLPHFQPILLKARLAANTAATLASVPDSHLSDALPALLAGDYVIDDAAPQVSRMTRRQAAEYETTGLTMRWQPECDPYRGLGYWDMADHMVGIEEEDGGGGLQSEDAQGHQSFLCHQAAALLGRHATKSRLFHDLAQWAGQDAHRVARNGRQLCCGAEGHPAADPRARPEPCRGFGAPLDMQPTLLMIWDFCQTYRALLRLPPIPLQRFIDAFLDEDPTSKPAATVCWDIPAAPGSQMAVLQPPTGPVPHDTDGLQQDVDPYSLGGADGGDLPAAAAVLDEPDERAASATGPSACAPGLSSAADRPPPAAGMGGYPPAAVGHSADAPQLLDRMELDPTTGSIRSPPVEHGPVSWGARGQAALLRDVHASLLRLLEGHEEELLELATLPGYGPAADLAPSDAYRPLLGLSWPALVHNALQQHAASITQPTAIAAVAQLTGTCYEQLGGRQRLAILEALLAIVADTEAVRGHMLATATAAQEQDEQGQTAPDKHMGLLGSDAAGVRYYLLAGDVGRRMLFVEGEDGSCWGWYTIQQLPALLAWMDGGCLEERTLADDIFEAFQPLLQPASHPQALNPTDAAASLGQLQGVWPRHATAEEKQLEAEAVPGLLADPGDGYRAVQNPVDWGLLLRQDLLDRLNSTRWWDKPLDWLQARAAVEKLVQAAETGPQLGRLIWLIEELTYDDLLKGTGWGRRRSPFREQLEQCRTLHQAAVLSGQLAIHCRSAHEMGHISRDDHVAAARQLRCPLPATPAIGQAVYVLRTAYEDHLRNTGFPDDPTPPRPPPEWGSLMRCTAAQVCHLRTAHPPRLSATGRFLPNMHSLATHADEGKRLLTVLLLQPAPLQPPPPPTHAHPAAEPAAAANGLAAVAGAQSGPNGLTAAGSGYPSPAMHFNSQHNSATGHQSAAVGPTSVGLDNPAPTHDGLCVEGGEIDWQHFTFSHGFRLPRLMLPSGGSVPLAKLPKDLQSADLTPDGLLQLDAHLKGVARIKPDAHVREELAQVSTTSSSLKQEGNGLEGGSAGQYHGLQQQPTPTSPTAAKDLSDASKSSEQQQAGSSFHQGPVSSQSLQLKQESSEIKQESAHSLPHNCVPTQQTLTDQAMGSKPAANGTEGLHPAPTPHANSSQFNGNPLHQPATLVEGPPTLPISNVPRLPAGPVLHVDHGRPVSQPLGPHGETGEMGEDGDMSGGSDEDEDIGGKRMTTRSRRPRNQDHFMLNAGNVAVAQAAKAAMAAGQTLPPLGFRLQAGEEEAVRWWVRPRAYGVATVRSSHTPGFQPLPFLFPAEIIETGWDQRIWKAGTPVKMPADGTPIHQAMVQPQVVHWYSGVLQNTFVPLVAPGQTVPDPCRALRIAWDEDTPAPIARLPGFHPWQVAVDEGGLLRGHKQRLKAEALMRCQADIRARNEAAMKRAAEREAAAESLRMASQARAEAARQQYLQQQASQRPGSQPSTLPPQVGLQQHMHGQAPALPGHLQRPHGLPEQPSEASPSHKQLTASQLPTAASQQQPAGPQGTPQQPYGPQQDAASATLRSMGLQQSSMNGPPALTSLPEAQQAVPGSYSALLTDQDPLPGSPAQQAMAGATSGEDGAAKARPRKRKGREGDEGEGKEPRAGRVRKAQKGPSEGYRDRWLARKPRPNPTTWCSAACSACEKGGPGLLVCMGPCLRAFHLHCLRLHASVEEPWFCPECQTGRVRCFVCGGFSTGMDDAHVRKCSLGVCGRFYHMTCVEKLELTQMAKKGMHFRCPQHYCASCHKSGDGIDMVKCLRCPTAYHSSCMPKHLQRLVPPHKVILCDQHADEAGPPGYVYPPAISPATMQHAQAELGSHKKPRGGHKPKVDTSSEPSGVTEPFRVASVPLQPDPAGQLPPTGGHPLPAAPAGSLQSLGVLPEASLKPPHPPLGTAVGPGSSQAPHTLQPNHLQQQQHQQRPIVDGLDAGRLQAARALQVPSPHLPVTALQAGNMRPASPFLPVSAFHAQPARPASPLLPFNGLSPLQPGISPNPQQQQQQQQVSGQYPSHSTPFPPPHPFNHQQQQPQLSSPTRDTHQDAQLNPPHSPQKPTHPPHMLPAEAAAGPHTRLTSSRPASLQDGAHSGLQQAWQQQAGGVSEPARARSGQLTQRLPDNALAREVSGRWMDMWAQQLPNVDGSSAAGELSRPPTSAGLASVQHQMAAASMLPDPSQSPLTFSKMLPPFGPNDRDGGGPRLTPQLPPWDSHHARTTQQDQQQRQLPPQLPSQDRKQSTPSHWDQCQTNSSLLQGMHLPRQPAGQFARQLPKSAPLDLFLSPHHASKDLGPAQGRGAPADWDPQAPLPFERNPQSIRNELQDLARQAAQSGHPLRQPAADATLRDAHHHMALNGHPLGRQNNTHFPGMLLPRDRHQQHPTIGAPLSGADSSQPASRHQNMSGVRAVQDSPHGEYPMPSWNPPGRAYPQQIPGLNPPMQPTMQPGPRQASESPHMGGRSGQMQGEQSLHTFLPRWEHALERSGELSDSAPNAGNPSHSLLPQVPGLDLGGGIPHGMDGMFPLAGYPLQSLPQAPGLETGQSGMQPLDPVLAALGRRTPPGNSPSQGPGPQHGSMNPPQSRMDHAFLEALHQDPGRWKDTRDPTASRHPFNLSPQDFHP